MENKPNRIIWHHSASAGTGHQAVAINEYHKARGFPLSALGFYGGYHILIEKDGTNTRYRNDNEIGAHDKDENINSLGVCMAGNFDIEQPTEAQKDTLKTILNTWILEYTIDIANIEPHRKNDTTHCPGLLLADDWAQKLIDIGARSPEKDKIQKIIDFCKSIL